MNNYDYKNSEIRYLGKKLNIIFPEKMSLNQYIDIKHEAFINLQGKYRLNTTNKSVKKEKNIFINPKISYQYSYARFDSYIDYKDFLKDFYHVNNKKYKVKLFFTNSGMSAITSLLVALKKVCKEHDFLFPDEDIYFETYDFYNKYIKSKKQQKKDIVYLDTISKLFDTDRYLNFLNHYNTNPFAIIIDTTCFYPDDLKKFISNILDKNIFCILIRSHIKLDMLGDEISSLGSLFYLIPSQINSNEFKVIKQIIIESYYILGKFGSLCLPEKFPEIIFEKKFMKINKQRIRRIEKNNYDLFMYLKDNINNGKVLLPNHRKFILYIINNSIVSEKQNKMIEDRIKHLVNNNCQLYSAGSFGFDYVVLDSYYDINEKNYVVRISMNDSEYNKNIFQQIKEFINGNF